MTRTDIAVQDADAGRKKLLDDGYLFVPAAQFQLPPKESFVAFWDNLPADQYLKHDYTFRYRRYGQATYVPNEGSLTPIEPKPYEQSTAINAYAGGLKRVLPPLLKEFYESAFTLTAVKQSFSMFSIEPEFLDKKWIVDFHLFRIVARPKEDGLPTPEGVHQDGFPFGSIHFVQRQNVTGGKTSIYGLDDRKLASFEMKDFYDTAYLFDQRVKHGVSPLATDTEGFRDVFIIAYHLPQSKYAKP